MRYNVFNSLLHCLHTEYRMWKTIRKFNATHIAKYMYVYIHPYMYCLLPPIYKFVQFTVNRNETLTLALILTLALTLALTLTRFVYEAHFEYKTIIIKCIDFLRSLHFPSIDWSNWISNKKKKKKKTENKRNFQYNVKCVLWSPHQLSATQPVLKSTSTLADSIEMKIESCWMGFLFVFTFCISLY